MPRILASFFVLILLLTSDYTFAKKKDPLLTVGVKLAFGFHGDHSTSTNLSFLDTDGGSLIGVGLRGRKKITSVFKCFRQRNEANKFEDPLSLSIMELYLIEETWACRTRKSDLHYYKICRSSFLARQANYSTQ